MKLNFDLHVHSNYSFDSRIKIRSLLRRAKKIGLDGIAITDHGKIDGAIKAEKLAKGIIIIKGEEIKTEIGDVIGLFLEKRIKDCKFKEAVKGIKKQGGIVLLPHPATYHIIDKDVIKMIDVVEVFNSRLTNSANKMAENLAKKYKKVGIAGSDAHFLLELGTAKTIITTKDKSKKSIKRAILKNKIKLKCRRLPLLRRSWIKLLKYWRENVC